jgi:hypothetical protein
MQPQQEGTCTSARRSLCPETQAADISQNDIDAKRLKFIQTSWTTKDVCVIEYGLMAILVADM